MVAYPMSSEAVLPRNTAWYANGYSQHEINHESTRSLATTVRTDMKLNPQ